MKHRSCIVFIFLIGSSTSALSQSFFNNLDTTLLGYTSLVPKQDSSFIISGSLWGSTGVLTSGIVDYSSTGDCIQHDTLEEPLVYLAGSKLLKRSEDYLIYALRNEVPPYDSEFRDIQLSCYTYSGDSLWTKIYGSSDQDVPAQVIELTDSGLFILGSTTGFGDPDGDFYLIKTDADGNLLWEKTYGGSSSELAYSVNLTKDGNYILSGHKLVTSPDNWDIHLIKIDPEGEVIWEKTYGGSDTDYGGLLFPQYDHNFIVYKNVDNGVIEVGHVDKLDGNGDLIWSKTFPYGSLSTFQYFPPFENPDGTIIVSCGGKNSENHLTPRVIKLDPTGDTIWTREYYTTPYFSSYMYDMKPALDGGYVMCGSAFNSDTVQCGWFFNTDCNGNEDNLYPTGAPCEEYDCTLYPIDASFTAGTTTIDIAAGDSVTFTNSSANPTSRVWNFGDGTMDYTDAVISHIYTTPGTYEVELIVFHGMCSDTSTVTVEVINSVGITESSGNGNITVYPNPNNGSFIIDIGEIGDGLLTVTDVLGRTVYELEFDNQQKIEMSDFSSGVYMVQLNLANGEIEVIGVVVER